MLAARAVWVMLDGVGLAEAGPTNPLSQGALPTLAALGVSRPAARLETQWVARPVDATLGVPGLPQSGTGQTTLLAGVNAAARLGYHHGPWPGPSLRPLLEASLPARLGATGRRVRVANAYPPAYLEAIASGRQRLNAIATAATLGGASLAPEGVPAHLGGDSASPEHLRGWGRDLASSTADLTIFDAWWSDLLGHRGSPQEARAYAGRLEAFLGSLLEHRPSDTLLLLTSDHGNFEAMDVKTHTRNPVPLAAVGPGAAEFAEVADLAGVAPALERALGGGVGAGPSGS